jgi:hypothetical protein
MATINQFEDLDAWKVSRTLCNKIGTIIDDGAFRNNFRIINQIEGASGSIMDNIAEGFERGTRREFMRFLSYSKGSCAEFRSQLYRALDRKNITQEQFDELKELAVRIDIMIHKFILYLNNTTIEGKRKKVTAK